MILAPYLPVFDPSQSIEQCTSTYALLRLHLSEDEPSDALYVDLFWGGYWQALVANQRRVSC